MFWLAGILGLLAAGSIAMVDMPDEDTEEEGGADLAAEAEPGRETDDLLESSLDTNANTGDTAELTLAPEIGGSGDDIIAGGSDDDHLIGLEGDDQIGGYEGDDLIEGGAGHDDLHGHDGDDTVDGGTGDDVLQGWDGADRLNGQDGEDLLLGHSGEDTLDGGDGADTAHGGTGDDVLNGGAGSDALHGNDGNDSLVGGEGTDALFGGTGDDHLSGIETRTQAGDFLNGGAGDDVLLTGSEDTVTAGDGSDSIVLGDWMASAEPAHLMDYDATEDRIVIVWDFAQNPDPQIMVDQDAEYPSQSRIRVDGVTLATVRGATTLSVQDIVLVDGQSAGECPIFCV